MFIVSSLLNLPVLFRCKLFDGSVTDHFHNFTGVLKWLMQRTASRWSHAQVVCWATTIVNWMLMSEVLQAHFAEVSSLMLCHLMYIHLALNAKIYLDACQMPQIQSTWRKIRAHFQLHLASRFYRYMQMQVRWENRSCMDPRKIKERTTRLTLGYWLGKRSYSTLDKECLEVVWAAENWRLCQEGHWFKVIINCTAFT